MTTLLIADHDNAHINDATLKTITAAKQLGAPVTLLVAGHGCANLGAEAAKIDGVDSVLMADDASLAHMLAEPMAALIVSIAGRFTHILAAATANGKNIMPRVAAMLDVMQISDVLTIISADTFERPIYAGNAIQTVQSQDALKVMTIRTAGFKAAGVGGNASIETLNVSAAASISAFKSEEMSQSARPELTSAKIIVSGGRALASSENFKAIIEPLADQLGAALGASRAAVDAGYAPNDWQVGQTGKIVAPDLYIACGISGAIQHLAGMKDSKVIVAINKDEDAPIFQVADYGLVADLFTAVPELTRELSK
jgi:electron transfer flavoprotein alpha subunit